MLYDSMSFNVCHSETFHPGRRKSRGTKRALLCIKPTPFCMYFRLELDLLRLLSLLRISSPTPMIYMYPLACGLLTLSLTACDFLLCFVPFARPLVQINADGMSVKAEYQVKKARFSGSLSPPVLTAVGGYYTKLAVRNGSQRVLYHYPSVCLTENAQRLFQLCHPHTERETLLTSYYCRIHGIHLLILTDISLSPR